MFLATQACALDINSIELEKHKYYDTLAVETSDYTTPKAKMLENPLRLVLNFTSADYAKSFSSAAISSSRVSSIKKDGSSLVILLKRPVDYEIASILGKNQVVVELREKPGNSPVEKAEAVAAPKTEIPASGLLAALDEKPIRHKEKPPVIEVATAAKTAVKIVAKKPKVEEPRAPLPSKDRSLRGKTIFVDAGHGGGDPGALAHGLVEKEMTLRTALELSEILRAAGARVYLTRKRDVKINLPRVTELANRSGADAFVSVHYNFIENPGKKGTETYYYSSQSSKLAESVHRALLNGIHREDRGVRKVKFYVIHHTSMPSILVEPLYLSNRDDADCARNRGFYHEVAQDIATGIKEYFKWTK